MVIKHSMKYTKKYDESGNLIENNVYNSGTELNCYIYSYDKNGTRIATRYLSAEFDYMPDNPISGIYTATISIPALNITRIINFKVEVESQT